MSILLLVMACTATGKIIYVDANGGNNGSRANFQPDIQYPSIQAAIDAAIDGDTIILAPGTFRGDGNRDIDFKGKAITLRSTDPNDPNIVATTIIDCNGTELENHRGFYFHSGEDENSVVEGLTITNGFNGSGGGILCIASSPIIRNNIITGNKIEYDADGGAGIGCWYGASPLIVGNTISDNHCEPGGGGGGIRCYEAGTPTITGNIIAGNSASQGGGILIDDCSPVVINCTITENSAGSQGGGMLISRRYSKTSPRISNCTFSGNSASVGGGMHNSNWRSAEWGPTLTSCTFNGNSAVSKGGGIYNMYTTPTLINCAFTGNSAGNYGGGMYNSGYRSYAPCSRYNGPTLNNCTFSANSAPDGNALACDSYRQCYPSDLQITNCILWDGGNEIWVGDSSQITITYSDIDGGYTGTGNIDADPLFIDPGYWDANGVWVDGDYHLLPDSPCIDAGDNSVVPSSVSTDLDGWPRIINGTVDMGAYEYQGPRTIYVDDDGPADFNTIQAAIDDANDGDTIIVADGTYTGQGNRDLDFLGKAITVRSENGPENCIIDCNGSETEYHRGFYFHSGEDANSILAGITITNGYTTEGAGIYCYTSSSPTISNCTLTANCADRGGGGITIWWDSGPTLANCTFSGNLAAWGGGMCIASGSPTVTNCTFKGNSAKEGRGGGIYIYSDATEIIDCTISNNWAKSSGGGIYVQHSDPVLTRCTFIGNRSEGDGGGIHVFGCTCEAYPKFNWCRIIGNSATGSGAGLYNDGYSLCMLNNCIIAGNSAGGNGGGMCNEYDGGSSLINCTVTGNSSESYGGGISYGRAYRGHSLTNCIVWNNSGVIYYDMQDAQIYIAQTSVQIRITYNCIRDWTGYLAGTGNFDADPCFANPGYWADANDHDIVVQPDDPNAIWVDGDYHVKSQAGRWDANERRWTKDEVTSPCIDAGDMATPIGYEPFPNGGRDNMGAYGGTVKASKSYFGEPVCETVVAGDINGDCIVNFEDFAFMALHWLQNENL